MGYVEAFNLGNPQEDCIVGIDINPQPNYPFTFVQLDIVKAKGWLKYFQRFDIIHASPPCQRYSTMTKRHGRQAEHPDLIPIVRKMLRRSGRPYVIENVVGAPLIGPVLLCGSMFRLGVRRHRLFECSFPVVPLQCKHKEQGSVVGVYGHAGGSSKRDGLCFSGTAEWRRAMGIEWMTGKELAQAIPPAYTKWIGEQYANL